MAYESNNPQTNLSIREFYQKLAYKWKNWLSEANKREIMIPTTIINEEELALHLLPNADINWKLKVERVGEVVTRTTYPILEEAERLLARQVLETIDYQFNTDSEWDTWDEDSFEKVHNVGWVKDLDWTPGSYISWVGTSFTDYPLIIFIDPNKDSYKKVTTLYLDWLGGDETITYDPPQETINYMKTLEEYNEEDKFERHIVRTAAKEITGIDGFHNYHNEQWTYHKVSGVWVLHIHKMVDRWDWYWLQGQFTKSRDDYGTNQDITDRRINILMDVDVIASL